MSNFECSISNLFFTDVLTDIALFLRVFLVPSVVNLTAEHAEFYTENTKRLKKFEIEHSKFEIKTYFCPVNQGLVRIVFPSFFHGAPHRISRVFNHSIYLIK
jgi:hypothetical protein